MSPHQRLLRAKMNHAASRLRQPGVLVKDVAAEMGFSDPFHFSRAFRRCFHVSPAKFRG
jgi:AraC-like DNA-binding protein